jgi:hypothetical protein
MKSKSVRFGSNVTVTVARWTSLSANAVTPSGRCRPSSLVMNERICRLFKFFSCTTAPVTALSSALVTAPCTLRVVGSPFFFVCPKLAGTQQRRRNTVITVQIRFI